MRKALIVCLLAIAGQSVLGQNQQQLDSLALEYYANNQYEEAIETAEKGLKVAEDEATRIDFYSTLAVSYIRLGMLDKALDCASTIYRYDQQYGDTSDLSYDLNLLAGICHSSGREEDAAEYIAKAVEYAREGGPEGRSALAIRLGNAADIYRSAGRLAEALASAREAYQIDLEDGRPDKAAVRQCQLAGCLAANQNILQAETNYREAIAVLETQGNRQSLCIACRELAAILPAGPDKTEFLERAVQLASEIGDKRNLMQSTLDLSRLLTISDPIRSYELITQSMALRDTLQSEERTREIDRFNIQFRTLEKELKLEAYRSRLILLFVIVALLLAFIATLVVITRQLYLTNRELSENLTTVSRDLAANEATPSPAPASCETVRFSPRELDIIRLSCQGKLSKEVAAELGISVKTVDNIKSGMFQKLGINTTLELVIYAIRHHVAE